jgi:hypothetical protein
MRRSGCEPEPEHFRAMVRARAGKTVVPFHDRWEERTRIGASGVGLHNDVVGPYLRDLAGDEQQQRGLPDFTSGEPITAIATAVALP